MEIIIDNRSGFCFGVKKVIALAEKELTEGGFLYCLGDIVHNEQEILRLSKLGLKVIEREEYFTLKNCKVLIRAHGEPPEVYDYARVNQIELLEGTCPIVLKLQDRVRKYHSDLNGNGTLIIFGKSQHPEVIGLSGQVNYEAKIITKVEELDEVDFTKPVSLLSQTTMNRDKFKEIKDEIEKRSESPNLFFYKETICGQLADRGPWLEEFSQTVDAMVFVGGEKSSNSKVLYQHCLSRNPNSFFISSADDVKKLDLSSFRKIGISGATSTPGWLLQDVGNAIKLKYS